MTHEPETLQTVTSTTADAGTHWHLRLKPRRRKNSLGPMPNLPKPLPVGAAGNERGPSAGHHRPHHRTHAAATAGDDPTRGASPRGRGPGAARTLRKVIRGLNLLFPRNHDRSASRFPIHVQRASAARVVEPIVKSSTPSVDVKPAYRRARDSLRFIFVRDAPLAVFLLTISVHLSAAGTTKMRTCLGHVLPANIHVATDHEGRRLVCARAPHFSHKARAHHRFCVVSSADWGVHMDLGAVAPRRNRFVLGAGRLLLSCWAAAVSTAIPMKNKG